MNFNPKIWSDLNQDEKKAYRIYLEFQKRTLKRGQREKWLAQADAKSFDPEKLPATKIRESKHWKYFCEVWDVFKEDPNFDEVVFIESVFKNIPNDKKIVPAQLRTMKILNQYKDLRMKLKMSEKYDDQKLMMREIANSYKFICRKLEVDQLSSADLNRFFSEVKDNNVISYGILFCMQDMISKFYLSVSKSFMGAYLSLDKDIQDEILDPGKYQNFRSIMKLKTKVYEFAKKLFRDDII